jgi:pyruvate/2-oxoglutarate dehydrogenase complex dihydrolipoamide dehydrogenase (E3) component
MTQTIHTDLCIIGAGSAGLSIAAGASQMGAKVVLIEGHRMGGDCLNTGCVPSKSLLAAAKAAKVAGGSAKFGVNGAIPTVNFGKANAHVHNVIAAIAPHDSVERFEGLGCTVIQARGRFTGPRTVEAGGQTITARTFVVATGSRAAVPPIPGLADVPYMTNESVFDNTLLPDHLVIVGGGPIGCEMAQAHRRLGARVTILDAGGILPKDDPEAVAVVRARLVAEGVDVREKIRIVRVMKQGNGIAVVLAGGDGREETVAGSHLLIAAGRKANVEDLGLEAAGVDYTPRGITVDARLRTSNRRIYAAGDVAGGYQFTHLAGYHAGIIIRNALFWVPAKAQPAALPWVTYTDPEVAQVGLTEAQAKEQHGDGVRVVRAEFKGNDRAVAEGDTDGFMKVTVAKSGHILGATLVGAGAGELILPWVLAMTSKLKIGAMAAIIAPYPTRSEITKRAAGAYYTPTLFSNRTRWIVRTLQSLS